MKKIFESPDGVMVGHYASILESNGILVMVKNAMDTQIELVPVIEVPQLWVMNDEEVDQALGILRQLSDEFGGEGGE